MAILHDPAVRDSLKRRVQSLRPDSRGGWGRMSVDQMLWHVNESFRMALGDAQFQPIKTPPLPKSLMRWLLLNAPWPKGRAPTYKEMLARTPHDFDAERARCLALIDRMVSRQLEEDWPVNPTVGRMSGRQWSQLQAKHLDHHLRQFGA